MIELKIDDDQLFVQFTEKEHGRSTIPNDLNDEKFTSTLIRAFFF